KNQDGSLRQIEALHVRGIDPATKKELPENGRTVVLYHGNVISAYEFYYFAQVLKECGFNVYASTMGGENYNQSRDNALSNNVHATNELSVYAEVDADREFLKIKGVTQMATIGLSIGGTKAFQMALKYGRMNQSQPRCKAIIPDQTLGSGKKVMENTGHNLLGLGKLGAELGEMTFSYNVKDAINGNATDGLNNLSKAQLLRGYVPLLACRATKDILMGKGNRDEEGRFENDFAYDLASATSDENPENHVISLEGSHGFSWLINDPVAKERVIDFLDSAMPRAEDPN
ncbi:MAG TPA: alpha/beta fold hydrolase, partial [Chlamydiales bacterium]|nr:alpha/beta fold hydrolase [Chlamydiales bacterium]